MTIKTGPHSELESCVLPVCDSFSGTGFCFSHFLPGFAVPGADLLFGWTKAGGLAGLLTPFTSSEPAGKGWPKRREDEGTGMLTPAPRSRGEGL